MRVREFADIGDLERVIVQDAAAPTRYNARILFVSGLQAWQDVLGLLRSRVDQFICLSDLCEGDSLPSASRVVAAVESASGTSVAVVPLGEVLRLAPGAIETYVTWLTAIERPGKYRVYVPLLDTWPRVHEEIDRCTHYVEVVGQEWHLIGDGDVDLLVTPFETPCRGKETVQGLHAYLDCWEHGGTAQGQLVTELAEHLGEFQGRFSVEVCRNGYDVIRQRLGDTMDLGEEDGTDAQWRWLAQQLDPAEQYLDETAGRLLDVLGYVPKLLYGLWDSRTPNKKWLTWLWSRLHPEGDGYLRAVLRATCSYDEIPARAIDAVLSLDDLSLEKIRSRQWLLHSLGIEHVPPAFIESCRRIEEPIRRLGALPGIGRDDREEIIATVSFLLEQGTPASQWLPILEITYPSLAAYLTPYPFDDESLRDYMGMYIRSKVKNAPEDELLTVARDWAAERSVWEYPTRASVLHKSGDGEPHTFWVDGLGIEWMGLLRALLLGRGLRVTGQVARATLPSITSTNAEWDDASAVMRDLDKIAHSYDYDHPQSFMEQMEIVERVADRVESLVQRLSTVFVTGDHGLTRFAASGERIDPPEGYEVHKWGRYAEASTEHPVGGGDGAAWLCEGSYLILGGHSLFRGGSRTKGEVHGGATPEESLVPVLCVRSADTVLPRVISMSEQVRTDVHGKGIVRLRLDCQVARLDMIVEGKTVAGKRVASDEWEVALAPLEAGHHRARVYADDAFVDDVAFEAIRGMQQTDLGL